MLPVLSVLGFWIYHSRNIRKFHFLNYNEFFRGFCFLKCKKFSWGRFFYFSSLKSYFLKYKKIFRVSVSWNMRNFLILEPESSISWKYKISFRGDFFYFSRPENYFLKCKRNIRLESSISGNIRKFRYARILNIPFLNKKVRYAKVLNMPFLKYKLFLRRYKKPFQSRFS